MYKISRHSYHRNTVNLEVINKHKKQSIQRNQNRDSKSQRSVQLVAQIKGVNEINCLKSAVVLMDIFMRLMNLVGYIFVHQDARYALKRDSIFNV